MRTPVSKRSIWSRGRRAGLYGYAMLVTLLYPAFVNFASAQGVTFKQAAQRIAGEVAGGAFGAMVVAITGILAIVSAVTGSYKGAWAVLYVSIGLYILKELVKILFPGIA